jgi:hypothetical protein
MVSRAEAAQVSDTTMMIKDRMLATKILKIKTKE